MVDHARATWRVSIRRACRALPVDRSTYHYRSRRAGGTKVAEIGPVPPLSAPEYLLRVNYGHGPPGAKTPVHTHPGSEAFYVVAGRLSQRTPQGVMNVEAGHSMNGHSAGMTMEVFNSGTTELAALIMFVVDATKPFSVPAKFE